jgi:signal transduction histidine kinase
MSGAPDNQLVFHPAMMTQRLDAAEEALYVDAAQARSLARAVADEVSDRPAGDPVRLQAHTLLVILDAQQGHTLRAIHAALTLVDEATSAGQDRLAARLHNVLGAAYDLLELPEQAVRHYGRCLALARMVDARDIAAKAETNLGVAWSRMDDDHQALEHFSRALELANADGRSDRQGRLHLDIAISQRRLGDLRRARTSLVHARESIERSGHRRSLPALKVQEGLILVEEAEHAAGIMSLEQAAALAEQQALTPVASTAYAALAKALRVAPAPIHDPARAVTVATKALEAAEAQDSDGLVCEALDELSRSCEAAGELRPALAHQRALLARRQAASDRRERSNVAALRVVHEVETLRKERMVLRSTNERLVAINREKAEILAIVSHDLRSPLTLMTMLADQLQEPGEAISPARAGAILESSAMRMLGVLDRLITTEALERGGIEGRRRPVDLAAVAATAVEALAMRAEQKGIGLTHTGDRPLWLTADPTGIGQIVHNLVDNAVKFSSLGGNIEVRTSRTAGGAELVVLDRGPGFTEPDLQSIFGKFARLTARPTAGESSHGLGLYVVRRMAEEMGGETFAHNRSGGGAAVGVRLPLESDEPPR